MHCINAPYSIRYPSCSGATVCRNTSTLIGGSPYHATGLANPRTAGKGQTQRDSSLLPPSFNSPLTTPPPSSSQTSSYACIALSLRSLIPSVFPRNHESLHHHAAPSDIIRHTSPMGEALGRPTLLPVVALLLLEWKCLHVFQT
jgi:hypothetical protein